MASDSSVLNDKKISPILNFYKGKSIFVTGGTGFLGTMLLGKLLLTCKDLKNIYLLVKSKHGLTIEERLEKLIDSVPFDSVRESHPEALKKLIPIEGNLLENNLGISETDTRTLQNEVSIVFHSAANVNFDVSLSDAINVNTRATERMLNFCKAMKQIQAFVYVSTAYCNCNLPVTEEEVYQSMPLKSAYFLANYAGSNFFTENVLEGRPNTYTFSKALAENLIKTEFDEIPAVIIRPSIITASQSEPQAGWVKGWNGVNNVLCAQGKGTLCVWRAKVDVVIDIIPVDYVANLMIAAAWDTHRRRVHHKKELKVFNCCSGVRNPLQLGHLFESNMRYCSKYFNKEVMFRPYLLLIKNSIIFWILFALLITIPMYILNAVDCLIARKRRVSMAKLHRKLLDMVLILGYFSNIQFTFIDRNVQELYKNMDETDRSRFNFNIEDVEWDSYLENYALGLKKYMLKETLAK